MIRLLKMFCFGLIPTLILAFTIKPAFPQDLYVAPPSQTVTSKERGVQVIEQKSGIPMRLGVGCNLELYGDDVHTGLCNIGRKDRVTVIDIGTRKYRIVRNEETNQSGLFYFGAQDIIGPVKSVGNCWVGPKVKFCAN